MQPPRLAYDVVIVGGGLVGTAMALALSGIAKRYRLHVAILDQASDVHGRATARAESSALDERATALALGSHNLLKKLGIWPALAPYTQAIERIDVSDQGQKFGTHMHAYEVGSHALGYVIQNQHLLQVFRQHLQQHCAEYVHFIHNATVTQVDNARTDSHIVFEQATINQSNNQPTTPIATHALTCQLIIMADGGKSTLREQMGIHHVQQSYEQIATVVNAKMSRAHHGLACERFTPQGPMAALPLLDEATPNHCTSGLVALVWTQPIERQGEIEAMEDAQLMAELQQQMGFRMGQFQALGQRQTYPLALRVAQEQVRQGLAIIGNAAHTLHPIAGQGFNLALRGVFALAEQVQKACEEQQAIGDLRYLQHVVQQGSQDQKRTVLASDKVMKLFSSQQKSLLFSRQLGLLAMDRLPLIKNIFTRSAMGLDRPLANVLPVPNASESNANPHSAIYSDSPHVKESAPQ